MTRHGTSVLGVALGGAKTTAALVSPGGEARLEVTAPTTAAAGSRAVVDLVVWLVSQVREHARVAGLPVVRGWPVLPASTGPLAAVLEAACFDAEPTSQAVAGGEVLAR